MVREAGDKVHSVSSWATNIGGLNTESISTAINPVLNKSTGVAESYDNELGMQGIKLGYISWCRVETVVAHATTWRRAMH